MDPPLTPDDTSAGGGNDKLNRKGSWKRFKETVKETVQGWVSHGGEQSSSAPPPDVPSAVFPSEDVVQATTNVSRVLHNTNCYSGSGSGSGNGGIRRKSEGSALLHGSGGRRHQHLTNTSGDIPVIVVTGEANPRAPPRKTSAVHIRATTTQDPDDPCSSFSFPRSSVVLPDISCDSPGGTRRRKSTTSSPKETNLDDDDDDEEEDDEIKKQMAVMKIRQAIDEAGLLLGKPKVGGNERRHSDISGMNNNVSEVAPAVPVVVAALPVTQGGPGKRRKSACDARGSISGGSGLDRKGSIPRVAAKVKPMIWEHFDTVPGTNIHGKCKACRMNVSCKFNTGNFVRHLQIAHKDIYRQYQNKIETQWTRSMLERNLTKNMN